MENLRKIDDLRKNGGSFHVDAPDRSSLEVRADGNPSKTERRFNFEETDRIIETAVHLKKVRDAQKEVPGVVEKVENEISRGYRGELSISDLYKTLASVGVTNDLVDEAIGRCLPDWKKHVIVLRELEIDASPKAIDAVYDRLFSLYVGGLKEVFMSCPAYGDFVIRNKKSIHDIGHAVEMAMGGCAYRHIKSIALSSVVLRRRRPIRVGPFTIKRRDKMIKEHLLEVRLNVTDDAEGSGATLNFK